MGPVSSLINSPEDIANRKTIEQEYQHILVDLKDLISALQLSRDDIKALHLSFCTIDQTSTSSIQLSEFLEFLHVLRTPFTNRVIDIFEVSPDSSRAIDFKSFLKVSWNYCTLSQGELIHFVYELYNPDEQRQELGVDEMGLMLGDLFGKNYSKKTEAVAILDEFASFVNKMGPLNLSDFRKFAKSHQKLLFPAFQMQLYMRQRVVGPMFWDRLTQDRQRLFKAGKLFKSADFANLEAHKDVDFYRNGFVAEDAQDEDSAAKKVYKHRNAHMSPLGPLAGQTASAFEKKSMSAMAARVKNPNGNALYVYGL